MNISSRPMVVLFNFCRKITNNFLILLVFFLVFANFTGCNIKKGKNQNKEIADQLNEALSNNNTEQSRQTEQQKSSHFWQVRVEVRISESRDLLR